MSNKKTRSKKETMKSRDVPMASPEQAVPMSQQEKKGGVCCGCCCDYRNAVFAICVINVISFFMAAATGTLGDGAFLALMIVDLIMTFVCLIGACLYEWIMVAISAAWAIITILIRLVLLLTDSEFDPMVYIFAIIFTILWTYPSVVLAVEIKKGIMTAETYEREARCCCN